MLLLLLLLLLLYCCCRQYARDVAAIQPRWLPELAPAFFAAKAAATSGAVGREMAGTAE
jgi:ATP-dependent RNA helicase DHX8/PRP22